MEKPLLHYDDTTGNTPHPGYWVTWSKLSLESEGFSLTGISEAKDQKQ